MVVEPGATQEGDFQFLAGTEVMRAQQIGNASIEALDHAIGLRMFGLGQAVVNTPSRTQLIKGVCARGRALPRGDEAVAEFLAVAGLTV